MVSVRPNAPQGRGWFRRSGRERVSHRSPSHEKHFLPACVTEDSHFSHTPFTAGHYFALCVPHFFPGVGNVGVVAHCITGASARST